MKGKKGKIKDIPKKIIDSITDTSLSRLERTYNMLVTIGLVGLALVALVRAISLPVHGRIGTVLLLSSVWVMLFAIHFLSRISHKIHIAIHLGVVGLSFVLVPVNFYQTGGFLSGTGMITIFVMVFICLLVESNIKYFYLTVNFAIFILGCIWQYSNPEYDLKFTRESILEDTIVTMAVIGVILIPMILFQNMIYRREYELTLTQKKEIEELNIAQNSFFSSMSHEIRTPINTIVGLNEMILREDISDEVAEDARRMQSAGRMLLTLVNDILDVSKMEAGKMEIVSSAYDTSAMLSEITNMIWSSAKAKGLDFRINIGGRIPAHLVGDETRIKQILVNILNNAIKYTPKGSVTLSVQCERSMGEESVAIMSYSVTDTGIGIKQENIPHLFTVFKRVDLEKTHFIEGTGLGLSIVKQLLDLMGGTIEVNSVYTQGSTFTVTIPQIIEQEEEIDSASIEARHNIDQRVKYNTEFIAPDARVLIVDDNEANLLVAEKLLRDTKVKIETASSGQECLRKTLQNRYDAIFMDHLMPEMDGIECLHEIRRQARGLNAETPVVILTANAGSDNQMLYRREGFDGILLKPITGRQIEQELLKHLPRELVMIADSDEINALFMSPVHSSGQKVPIMICTDGSSDIPRELIKKNNITILPADVETDGGVFLDGVEIDPDGLMRYLQMGGKNAVSIDQSPEDYSVFFSKCLAKAQHIVYISISSSIVSNYASACEAAKSFSSVSVFDSWNISSGLGIMVLKACEYLRHGMTIAEIQDELTRLRDRIQTSYVVGDTKYLLAAGRISKLACRICDTLMLHPIIVIKKSFMKTGAIKTGIAGVFWKKYIKWVLRHPETIDKSVAFITYAGMDDETLYDIEKEIRARVDFKQIYFQKASTAISANCGPGAFGVIFMRNAKSQ